MHAENHGLTFTRLRFPSKEKGEEGWQYKGEDVILKIVMSVLVGSI